MPRKSRPLAFESEDFKNIPIEVRSFAKAFHDFSAATQQVRRWLGTSPLTQDIHNFMDKVEYTVAGAKQQLQRAIDREAFEGIDERMQVEGISLENFLQSGPTVSLPTHESEELERFLSAVDELHEHLIELAKEPAFSLASYLLKAKF